MAEGTGDKKHPASERRRRQAREQGQVVRSMDLSSAILLLLAIVMLRSLGPRAVASVGAMTKDLLGTFDPMAWNDVHEVNQQFLRMGGYLASIVFPLLALMTIGGVASHVIQSGILFLPEKLAPDFERINPLKAAQRLLSLSNVMRLVFGLFKLAVIVAVCSVSVRRWSDAVLGSGALTAPELGRLFADCVLGTALWVAAALLALAVADFAYQWWQQEQNLMMTDQELRDEMKESEGDPQVAARRRQVQRQLAMQRLRSEVPKADVVITNPTELAIALKYDPTTMPAPLVLAKGAGMLAQRIRRLALENGIVIVERKPLAQALYKAVDVGKSIPVEQYQAVAEVLRYVYQLQGKEIPKAQAA
jgi:flagellar biosynthesis protein FlhB